MRRLRPAVSGALLLGLALSAAACGESTSTGAAASFDATALLHDLSTDVILPTYQDLEARSAALDSAAQALAAAPTAANLAAAQNAWRAARRPWEQSEAFLFGPVETDGIDPGIDSWPVNVADLDAVLASSATLDEQYIEGLQGTLKGFHTIEYLLFGSADTLTAAGLSARDLEYLTASTAALAAAAAQVRAAWDPAHGNYVATLSTAGASGNTVYVSQSAAMQELINGMIDICDEVANSKISDPFDQHNRNLEESQFSNNSDADFADNIRSVQHIYLGAYGADTVTGVRALVLAKAPALDATIQTQTSDAIAKIEAMLPTFGAAITADSTAVEAARTAVRTLQQTLTNQLLPLAQ